MVDGGTGFFISNHYNSNLSKHSYFNAYEKNKAIEYFRKIALGRGDTDSVENFNTDKNIEVLIPEAVKRNPQKEHGNGGEFLNSLEAVISGSDSVVEAGLGVMSLGLVSITKED